MNSLQRKSLTIDPRDCFDAALIPGMRGRLAESYARFRALEAEVVQSLAPSQAGGIIGSYYDRDCPCCGTASAGVAPVIVAKGLELLDCPGCGFTYTRQVMDESSDAARYASSPLDFEAMRLRTSGPYLELETARDRYYLAALMRGGLAPGSLLEVGCGTGTLLVEAQRLGWRTLGVEPGEAAATVAQDRGSRVVRGWFPADLPAGERSFDAIAMLDVLEHFADPLQLLAEIRAHLAPHGRLLVQVPNWESLLVQLEGDQSSVVSPGHWSYFEPGTLSALLSRAGFRPLLVETVVSEFDRIMTFPTAGIMECLSKLRPAARIDKLSPATLFELNLGYKLVGVFELD